MLAGGMPQGGGGGRGGMGAHSSLESQLCRLCCVPLAWPCPGVHIKAWKHVLAPCPSRNISTLCVCVCVCDGCPVFCWPVIPHVSFVDPGLSVSVCPPASFHSATGGDALCFQLGVMARSNLVSGAMHKPWSDQATSSVWIHAASDVALHRPYFLLEYLSESSSSSSS